MLTISNMLKNEIYLGNVIYNRRSQKLGEKQVANPRGMWIRCDHTFKPIIPPKLFARAQKVRVELECGRTSSDKELLDDLAALLRKKGHLSMKIMQSARELPHWTVYAKRFGSIMNAYKRVGFKPHCRYNFTEIAAKIDAAICEVATDIVTALEQRRVHVTFLPVLYLLTLNRGLTVGMAVARSMSNGIGIKGPSQRWEVRRLRFRRSYLTLVIRMNESNTAIKDYFLMPTANLPATRDNRMRISDRFFGEFRYDAFDAVLKALTDHLNVGRMAPAPRP
jgi:hypothetical protein